MDTRTIQAVVFDLDGVLMDSEWLAFHAWREVVEARGGRLEADAFPGMLGISAEATAEYVMRRTGVTFDVTESVAYTWQWMLDRLKTDVEPLPGAVELVRGLAQERFPLAIASNGLSGYIENAMTGLKLTPFFPVRVGVDQVAQGKPAPDVYLEAARRLGVEPARCLAIEDSRVGVQAAASAGMRVIAVPDRRDPGKSYPGAWRIYPSLVEVRQDLAQIIL